MPLYGSNTYILTYVLKLLAACIKLATSYTGAFWLAILAQIGAAFAQLYVLALPPIVSAAWFGALAVGRK